MKVLFLTLRIILATVFALLVVPAWAGWVAVTESGSTVYYVDPSHIKKEGDVRRLFLLEVRNRPGVGGEMSRKTQVEFDCKNRTARPRSVSSYTGTMGSGQVIYSDLRGGKAHAVEADSVEGQVFNRACAG